MLGHGTEEVIRPRVQGVAPRQIRPAYLSTSYNGDIIAREPLTVCLGMPRVPLWDGIFESTRQ